MEESNITIKILRMIGTLTLGVFGIAFAIYLFLWPIFGMMAALYVVSEIWTEKFGLDRGDTAFIPVALVTISLQCFMSYEAMHYMGWL